MKNGTMLMRYYYTAAWSMLGGINLPADHPPIELVKKENSRFLLTNDPDSNLVNVDEAFAIGMLMLRVFEGKRKDSDFSSSLSAEIEEVKTNRRKNIKGQAVLLFETQGELEVEITKPLREHDRFIVTFDAFPKGTVGRKHQREIEAMKVALAMESQAPIKYNELASGTWLINENGKIIYSISLSMSGEGHVSMSLPDDAIKRISNLYTLLFKANNLNSVGRLFSQMTGYEADQLKAFISGWAALEILVSKSFKHYEEIFLSPFTKGEQPTLRERFLTRIKDVMKDKYRLKDKFIAVTAVLFPEAEDDEVKKDYIIFCELKKRRDLIFHGEPFSEKELPVSELYMLLKKYLLARLTITADL